ncbi:hypothetical protein ALC56_06173 [Trachymyrmex septentrionalis]|uniref:Uncharacterized protein n=1 Tax=Trachymyrmex septentrionalis TaxID=34720 RepID=A0A195FH20_9HYME|nr:hypothetical protein ALC56_06173 [Trachymyrmex septentrionalis]
MSLSPANGERPLNLCKRCMLIDRVSFFFFNNILINIMDDVLLVHMLDALTDLPHIINDFRLGHSITLSRNSFE